MPTTEKAGKTVETHTDATRKNTPTTEWRSALDGQSNNPLSQPKPGIKTGIT
jgi:hypothetical protein